MGRLGPSINKKINKNKKYIGESRYFQRIRNVNFHMTVAIFLMLKKLFFNKENKQHGTACC